MEQLAQAAYAQKTLAAQARAAGLDQQPQVRRAAELAATRALSDHWLVHEAQRKAPTAQQLEQLARSIFTNEKSRFSEGPRVHVRHLLVRPGEDGRDEAQALAHVRALQARIAAGEDFAELAQAESADKGSAARGGELSAFARGRMAPEFEQAAFELRQPGEVTGPVRTQFGYHLIQLIETLPEREPAFEDHRQDLVDQLAHQRQQQLREEAWRDAQKSAETDHAAIEAAAKIGRASCRERV